MGIKNEELLYHLTSLENLASILTYGLLSRNEVNNFYDVADEDIIDFRQKMNLNQYIPFHFFPGSPFAGRVQKYYHNIEFIYICISREFAKLNNFKIIPRHPNSMNGKLVYDYSVGYEIIEWDIMDTRDYSETTEPPKINASHLILMKFKLKLNKFNKRRLQKTAYFMNLFSGKDYFNFPNNKYGTYAHSVDILSKNIKEYQNFYQLILKKL